MAGWGSWTRERYWAHSNWRSRQGLFKPLAVLRRDPQRVSELATDGRSDMADRWTHARSGLSAPTRPASRRRSHAAVLSRAWDAARSLLHLCLRIRDIRMGKESDFG